MAKLGPSFADRIVADLVCPGCQGFLLPPILQCANGHCLCETCRQSRQRCTVCQEGFTNVRCRPLEALAEHYQLPCRYGCGLKIRLVRVLEHEATCPQRTYSCMIGKCSWTGLPSDLASHVSKRHSTEQFTLGSSYFSRRWDGHYVKLAVLDGRHLFWYHLMQDTSKHKYFRAFQFVGPDAEATKFRYSFAFSVPNSPGVVAYLRPAYRLSEDMQASYDVDVDFNNIVRYAIQRHGKLDRIPCEVEIFKLSAP